MCGFVGIARFDQGPIERLVLDGMLERVQTRGPDGRGVLLAVGCALGHARLSIVDPQTGAQPMSTPASDPRGRLHVVFNGEIYNHRALRKHLEARGHAFKSDHSDTEVLLHGYREWGAGLVERLEGMFAFAIWDEKSRRLFLARDHAGEKPLFVRCLSGAFPNPGAVAFGSLMSAVTVPTAQISPLAISAQGLLEYLRWGYCLSHTLFQDVVELPPGTWIEMQDGKPAVPQAYTPRGIQPVEGSVEAEFDSPIRALEVIEQALEEAVSKMLDADVPVGAFLSGGIDSGLVCALAQKHLTAIGAPPLQTFCMAMPDPEYDESNAARATAESIGSRHTTLHLDGPVDPISDLESLIGGMGEPLGDASILPTYWVARGARAHVKTLLSGDGGDELFAGYMRHQGLAKIRAHRWWVRQLPRPTFGQFQEKSKVRMADRLIAAAREKTLGGSYASMTQLFSPDDLHALVPHLAEKHPELLEPDPGFVDSALAESDPVRFGQTFDTLRYLPGDVLRKVDRASMHCALEVRAPFLDPSLIRTARRASSAMLTPRGQTKGLLRVLARRHLPAQVVDLPKQGFAVPIGQWFRHDLSEEFTDILRSGRLQKLGIQAQTVDRVLSDHLTRADRTHQIFTLVALSIWCEQTGI